MRKNILNDPRIIEICDNMYLVEGPDKGRFPNCHSFLFTGEKNILIDAGGDNDFIARLDNELGIDSLIISHSHPDHICSWHVLNHRKLIVPAEMPDAVFNLNNLGERFTGTRERGIHWVNIIGKIIGIQALRQPDGRFTDGDIFDIGTVQLEAIHTPGHLDDHYCFFEHKTGTLFTVDIDFTRFGPWYGNPEGKIKPFKESIRKIMNLPYNRVCPSHRLPHEGDASDLFENFLKAFDHQKEKIFSFLGQGKTLDEIAAGSPFYNNRFMDPIIQYAFEENMARKNLELLIEEGRVYEDSGHFIPL